MKQLRLMALALAILTAFGACEKTEEVKDTTVQIDNNVTPLAYTIPDFDGTLWEIKIIEYIGDYMSGEVTVNPVAPGAISGKVKINNKTEKVKISFTFVPSTSTYYNSIGGRKYTASFTFLNKGENNIVVINDQTLISGSIKSSLAKPIKNFFE